MKNQYQHNDDNEDLNWVRKTKKGHRNAFEKLVLKYQKRIYYTVRKIVLDHDDANDIVQDTFVKAFVNLDRFDEDYPFYPWLHRIAINTTLNYRTRRSRIRDTFASSEDNEANQISSIQENPLQAVLEGEFKDKVATALEQLPFDQRMVFIMRTSDELSYQEISEQLDISIGTVMSRLARARARLKELLQSYL